MRGTVAKILSQKWPRFAPKLAIQWPKYEFLDHAYLYRKIVPTFICIQNHIQTLDPNSLDYQNRPESPRIGAVQWPKVWSKIARILVQWLLVVGGLSTKITVLVHVPTY